MKVTVTTGATKRAELQSNRRHQQTGIQLSTCPSCRPTNRVVTHLRETASHSMDLRGVMDLVANCTLSSTTGSSVGNRAVRQTSFYRKIQPELSVATEGLCERTE